jgi:hypothetical protein
MREEYDMGARAALRSLIQLVDGKDLGMERGRGSSSFLQSPRRGSQLGMLYDLFAYTFCPTITVV